MEGFKVGDRVRVLRVPTTRFYAGRVGEVAWVARTAGGAALAYRVKLDAGMRGGRTQSVVVFSPHELEPEAGGTA